MSNIHTTTGADARQAKALRIADRLRIRRDGKVWIVLTESSNGQYRVDPEAGRCSCPDHQIRRTRCKHLIATEIVIRRETTRTEETVSVNGESATAVTETVKTVETARVTYRQDWPAYNLAQVREQERFTGLLRELCDGVEQPIQRKGRPRLPLADVIFALSLKTYSAMSGRRATGFIRDAEAKGLMERGAALQQRLSLPGESGPGPNPEAPH